MCDLTQYKEQEITGRTHFRVVTLETAGVT
jgi:hypothetical protein